MAGNVRGVSRGALGLAIVLLTGTVAQAYFLDANGDFDVRLRAYAQLSVLTDSSEGPCQPVTIKDGNGRGKNLTVCANQPTFHAGDLASQRNFYNPEFDANLTKYVGWMNEIPGLARFTPEEFKFRFAWWGFYDGVYDYMDPEWDQNRRNLKARFSESDNIATQSYHFNDQNKNFRDIYGRQNRINELYLDYTKGRWFFRVGRQAISWGESDDIALLDVSNPFDLTQAVPGLIEDLDEARIPLWTLRTTAKLINDWRWLSGLFVDAYLVPGVIDTTVPINPSPGGMSPFGAPGGDPQLQIPAGVPIHEVVVDRLPPHKWSESRWGARLTGVVARDYTVQGWFFRTYPEQPTPLILPGVDFLKAPASAFTQIDDRGFRTPICLDGAGNPVKKGQFGFTPDGRACSKSVPGITELSRRLESVIGLSASWFSAPVNGVVRTEAEYFHDEQAFIPSQNLNAAAQLPASLIGGKRFIESIPKTDFLRWVLGYDRFFFFRPLNPMNSFILSAAWHGQWNVFQRREQDFRNASTKPGKSATAIGINPNIPGCDAAHFAKNPLAKQICLIEPAKNFEDLYKFDNQFLQLALVTDYMHGKLEPRIVIIADVSGIFAFAPTATYRITDNVLLGLTYIAIEGSRRAGLATFRDRDQVQMRVTYQLN